MIDYHQLDSEGQVERLKNIAFDALKAYHLGKIDVQLIKHEMNTIFKVTDLDEKIGNNVYVLRVHPGQWIDKTCINSEMIFLESLAKEGGLLASRPVVARDGSYVQVVSGEGVPEVRCCVLFQWIDGIFYEEKLDNEILIKAGEYLGRLHSYGKSFKVPDGFKRPKFDFDGLFGKAGLFNPRGGGILFSNEQKDIFAEAELKIKGKLHEIGYGAEQFGFIHSDYYYKNFLIKDGEIGAIDFDMCGWGYYIFDIVMPYWPGNQGDIDCAYEYFFKGYKHILPIPEGLYEYRETFNAVRRLMDAYWIVTRQDHPVLRSFVQYVVPSTADYLKEYVSKRG